MSEQVIIDGELSLDDMIDGAPDVAIMTVIGALVAKENGGVVTLSVAGDLQELYPSYSNGTVTIETR